MPLAKLEVQSQTCMESPEGFTAMGETAHLSVSFPAKPGRWQVCPFCLPALNAVYTRLWLPALLCSCAPTPSSQPHCTHCPGPAEDNPSVPSESYHQSLSLPPSPSTFPRAALFSSPFLPATEGVRGIKGQELSEAQAELLLRNPGGAAINAGENVLCSEAICIAACCNTFVCIVPLLFSGV